MNQYTVSSIINAYEKSLNYPFKVPMNRLKMDTELHCIFMLGNSQLVLCNAAFVTIKNES